MRSWLLSALMLAVAACTSEIQAVDEYSEKQQAISVDARALCEIVEQNYVYFEPRAQAWPTACLQAQAAVVSATTSAQRLGVLEMLVDALYDPHVSIGTNSDASPRLVPSGTDYLIRGDRVVAVRKGSGAALAGVLIGDQVIQVNGRSLREAQAQRLQPQGGVPSQAQLDWALDAAGAGYRDVERSVTLIREGQEINLTLGDPAPVWPGEYVTALMLEEEIAYFRLNNSLGDTGTADAFDEAIEQMRDARGWILDLRDTPGGGGTDNAEPIIGRFISAPAAYQKILPSDVPPWDRMVEPHGDWTAQGPLVVLVGRWTGSMGEGMAIGLDSLGRGHAMGSDMARLPGGVDRFDLPETGIPIRFPTYDLAHMNGTPRHQWSPPIQIISDNGDGPDLALEAAQTWIEAQLP